VGQSAMQMLSCLKAASKISFLSVVVYLFGVPAVAAVLLGPGLAGADVIQDDGESGTSAIGAWHISSGANPYGSDSLYSRGIGDSYTFNVNLATPGEYQVFAWWTEWGNRSSSVPIDITDLGGTATVTVNQLRDGGQWNQLGTTWNFGTTATITVRSLGNGTTSADAIMLVPTGGNVAPVLATIGNQSVNGGNTLAFTVSATDSDGTIPVLSTTGLPSGAAFIDNSDGTGSFSWPTTSSDTGTYNISFVATDASDPTLTGSETITVLVVDGAGALVQDDGESGTSAIGAWNISSGANPYGSDSLYSRGIGDSYTFNVNLATPGEYQVFAWWTEWGNRSSSVPIDITDLGGTATVTVNQLRDGGQWNQLGTTWNFGTTATITVRSLGNGTTSADAIMLVPTAGSCVATSRYDVFRGVLPATGDDGTSTSLFFSIPAGGNGALGTATIVDPTTGEFEYLPDGDLWGKDSFNYVVDGVAGGSVTSSFTVIIEPRIMPLGDSITGGSAFNGVNFGTGDLRVGYRKPLFDTLDISGYKFDFVGSLEHGWAVLPDFQHEGHGGWSAFDIAWGRNPGTDGVFVWLDDNPADIVLLHAGTNDLANTTEFDIADILNEIDRWENSAGGNPLTVILALIIDQDPINSGVTTFNNNVLAMANNRITAGDDIIVVNQQNALVYPDDLSDNVHPNDNGYARMANVWLDALTNLNPNTDEVVLDMCP